MCESICNMRKGGVLFISAVIVPLLAFLLAPGDFQYHVFLKHYLRLLKVAEVVEISTLHEKFPDAPYGLFSTHVVLPSHDITVALLVVDADGKIAAVHTSLFSILSCFPRNVVDVSPLTIMPGLIDPHVHVNEPGRTDWEGYKHASQAAAAGGTTTILDMPLNNIPSTIGKESLKLKVSSLSETKPIVDVGLIGGVTPQNIHTFKDLIRGGVLALKSFMIDSQSVDFPNISKRDLRIVVGQLHEYIESSPYKNVSLPYILHAELDENYGGEPLISGGMDYDHFSYAEYESTRPVRWETDAVRLATEAANETRVHIHIAHVSHADVLGTLATLQKMPGTNRLRITTETCPHYMLWASEEILRGSVLLKCAPPIRSASNRERLSAFVFEPAAALKPIDLVASDHSPCPSGLKSMEGNLTQSWGGISGLQYRLQGTWTVARKSHASVTKVVELLAEAPARVFGLSNVKGFLRPGMDADMVIWDPEDEEVLLKEHCQHRHKDSPYIGMKVSGKVFQTLVRGKVVFSRSVRADRTEGFSFSSHPGQLLTRDYATGEITAQNPADWKSL